MKIKFNLGWILAIAAAIVLAAMGFMSFYYRTGGSLVLPIIVAVCLLVLPIVVNMFLVPAKECEKPFYFHKEATKEMLLLVAMIVLFLVSMPLVNHFFTVNSRTEQIATEVDKQRKQLEDMKVSYSKHVEFRTKAYRAYLQEVYDHQNTDPVTYEEVFPDGSNDLDLMVRNVYNKISLEGLNDTASAILNKEKISWWQLPSVMKNVDIISSALERNYKLMVERDHNFTEGMDEGDFWTYSYTTASDIKSMFTKTDGIISSLWTVLSVLIAYLLIMLPYIVAERDLRSKGLFAELRKDDDNVDEDSGDNENIGRL